MNFDLYSNAVTPNSKKFPCPLAVSKIQYHLSLTEALLQRCVQLIYGFFEFPCSSTGGCIRYSSSINCATVYFLALNSASPVSGLKISRILLMSLTSTGFFSQISRSSRRQRSTLRIFLSLSAILEIIYNTSEMSTDLLIEKQCCEPPVRGIVEEHGEPTLASGKCDSKPLEEEPKQQLVQIMDEAVEGCDLGLVSLSPETATSGTPQQFLEEELFTKDFLEISRQAITFPRNVMFPGFVEEVELGLTLKQGFQDYPSGTCTVQITAQCTNPQFNDSDVFSLKASGSMAQTKQLQITMKKGEKSLVRIAVKIPIVRSQKLLEGTVSIQYQTTTAITIPITANCDLPRITCSKELFKPELNMNVITIPARKSGRIPPIPFKNNSHFSFSLQAEAATTQDFSNRPYDLVTQSSVSCLANSPFSVNVQLRMNQNYEGPFPATDTIRKVLVLRVRNSSVYFYYPVEAYVYDSNATLSTMS